MDFQKHLDEMIDFTIIHTKINKLENIDFVISFITKQTEIDDTMKKISNKICPDAIIWFSYPKGTSKKYSCDFNRDKGWDCMSKYNVEPVRQVAIDEDWSALRFRNAAFIKKTSKTNSIH